MSQYKEEQLGEIFSLESIYPDELEGKSLSTLYHPMDSHLFLFLHWTVLEEEPYHQFKLPVRSEGHDEDPEKGYSCSLKFTYTPTYPEEPPVVEIMDDVNLDDEQLQRLKERLEKEAEDNLGMVMVFSLVSAANEWLNNEWDAEIKRRYTMAFLSKSRPLNARHTPFRSSFQGRRSREEDPGS